ncbi:hypothetical protein SAMD00023353_1400850 [Rosellinia necatrix]|uniref:Uncharacterized protein n=1 Tax=Rosellinia necatrix TaxID=77044 RepID=A0A1W2TCU2_ROSNE|nr:hypothetical protein SAMD00023353_1400850 [Rosellinia necatrix]
MGTQGVYGSVRAAIEENHPLGIREATTVSPRSSKWTSATPGSSHIKTLKYTQPVFTRVLLPYPAPPRPIARTLVGNRASSVQLLAYSAGLYEANLWR